MVKQKQLFTCEKARSVVPGKYVPPNIYAEMGFQYVLILFVLITFTRLPIEGCFARIWLYHKNLRLEWK